MGITPYQVIQQTHSPLVKLAMIRVEGVIQNAIMGGRGETFYDIALYARMPDEFTDNDIYAIQSLLEHDGWVNVCVCGGILYFNFPPVKGA